MRAFCWGNACDWRTNLRSSDNFQRFEPTKDQTAAKDASHDGEEIRHIPGDNCQYKKDPDKYLECLQKTVHHAWFPAQAWCAWEGPSRIQFSVLFFFPFPLPLLHAFINSFWTPERLGIRISSSSSRGHMQGVRLASWLDWKRRRRRSYWPIGRSIVVVFNISGLCGCRSLCWYVLFIVLNQLLLFLPLIYWETRDRDLKIINISDETCKLF